MLEEERVENNLLFNLLTFDKNKKLLTKQDFSLVFNQKTKVYSKYFYAFVLPQTPSKIGVVVAKKNHKLAVKRNKIKRVVREFFRLNYKLFNQVQIIVFAKKFDNYNNRELTNDLVDLMNKINEISKKNNNSTN